MLRSSHRDSESPNSLLSIQKILAKYPDSNVSRPLSKSISRFALTKHVRIRYVQRFKNPVKYEHLNHCLAGFCRTCQALKRELNQETEARHQEISQEILSRLDKATEERSYINNTDFMGYLCEQYGYESRFKFLRDKDVIFVLRFDHSSMIVVTALSMEHQIGHYLPNHVKYTKKEKIHG